MAIPRPPIGSLGPAVARSSGDVAGNCSGPLRLLDRRAVWAAGLTVPRATVTLAALAGSLFLISGATAGGYKTRDVGNWLVAASKDGAGCFLTRDYEGPGTTTLLLALDTDGTNRLSLLNKNWSVKPASRLQLDFHLSNGHYLQHVAIGIAAKGKRGFATNFEWRFPGYFAASSVLRVDRGDVPVVRLTLDGASVAMAELRRCVAGQKSDARAGSRTGKTGPTIPEDPFASSAKARRID